MGSGFAYTLRYKTVNSLLSDVRVDFSNYALENLIDSAPLIRVARACNYTLGLRIYQTKETLLDLEKGKVKLPDDFYSMNFAMMCGDYTETVVVPQGTNIEEVMIPPYRSVPASTNICAAPVICSNCHIVPCGCGTTVLQTPTATCGCGVNPCSCAPTNICEGAVYNPLEPSGDWWKKPRVFLNCKGDCVELIQHLNTETRTYSYLQPLRLLSNAQGVECGCPGLYIRSSNEAWIKDGFLYTNFSNNNGCGTVYISYQGMLENEDGELLVPDHEVIINYYEAAIKEKICENLMMNGEDMVQKLQYWGEKRKVAKGEAKAIVRMPNFEEMRQFHNMNRRAMYDRYYSMFATSCGYDSRY